MAARARGVAPPSWWMDALAVEMKKRGWSRTDLAKLFVDQALKEDRPKTYKTQMRAAGVKVTRFFNHGIRTADAVDVFRRGLGLPRFDFRARDLDQARALEQLFPESGVTAPTGGDRAAVSLVESLESGEHRLDELLADHSDAIHPSDANLRRGSRRSVSRSKAAKHERR